MTANPQIGENARQVFQALVMGEVVEPVSYTHLDVYKRQVFW